MNRSWSNAAIGSVLAFSAGFGSHFFYQRWSVPGGELATARIARVVDPGIEVEPQNHAVVFVPQAPATAAPADLPVVQARDLDKLRQATGNQTRIRGRVFRVGHSARSNTYFLDFGPSREALTAVIFASAVKSFEQRKLPPKQFEGKEIEIQGMVKDHPQYGLEVILENPAQVRIVN
jgi:hypothetical protein